MTKWLSVSALVVGLDQITKYWVVSVLAYQERVDVLPFFAWVRWHNEGAAFSFLSGAGSWKHWFFVCLAVGFAGFIVYELYRLPKHDKAMGWVFALILGGALGNLSDRLNHGHVIDFILVHFKQYNFPAFNVADSALFCGAALWIVLMIIERKQNKSIARQE